MTEDRDFSDPAEAERSAAERKRIVDVTGDRESVLAEVRDELVDSANTEVLRNVVLVRIARDDDGEPILTRHTHHTLAEMLERRFTFVRPTKRGTSILNVPGTIVGKVHDAPDLLDVPVVQQVVHAPIFGPNGELHTEPGLLREARAWFEPTDGMEMTWPVPEQPGPRELTTAFQILHELFDNFPFDTDADRANAYALLLQPFVKPMIKGPTPMYVVESPVPRTGKGKLIKNALFPALGYWATPHHEIEGADEWRKSLTSFLLRGKPVFFLDNVNERLDSGILASALTERAIEARVLGHTLDATFPVRCLWVMAANNPRLSQEIANRGVQIRLDARTANPGLRTGFRHPDIERWMEQHRAEMVWAALVVVRDWLANNRPPPHPSVPKFGGYESWNETMGGILARVRYGDDLASGGGVYLGDCFRANHTEFVNEHLDSQSDDVCAALDFWWDRFGDSAVTAADLASANVPNPGGGVIDVSIGDLLLARARDDDRTRSKTRELGHRLRELERQPLCGYRIEPSGTRKNRKLYVLRHHHDPHGG